MAFQIQLGKIQTFFAVYLVLFLRHQKLSCSQIHDKGLGELLPLAWKQSLLQNNAVGVFAFLLLGQMGVGSLVIHFQKGQIIASPGGEDHHRNVGRRNIDISVHNVVEQLGQLPAGLHKGFRGTLLQKLLDRRIVSKAAELDVVALRQFFNVGLQKLGQIAGQVDGAVGENRHAHRRVQDMYNSCFHNNIVRFHGKASSYCPSAGCPASESAGETSSEVSGWMESASGASVWLEMSPLSGRASS